MTEFRVYGPPGTGKTSFLSHWITQTAQRYGSESMLIASFTRSAAQTLVQQHLPVPRESIGTLHSHAYHAIGVTPITEKTVANEWNHAFPNWALSEGMDVDDVIESYGRTEGDRLYNQVQTYRARMLPPEVWPNLLAQHFYTEWQRFKAETSTIDFTDMIELAYQEVERAPGNPQNGFYDEVQDFTLLELSLIRKWSQHMENVVLAGDDDQCIYRFKGATPDAFLDPPVPDSQKRVLAQSYRLPYLIQLLASEWITHVTRREEKQYAPRQAEGDVRFAQNLSFGIPARVLTDAEQYLADGKTVFFLTTCAYMLDPIKHELRKRGIPFHNPYKRRRGDWNPLMPGRGTPTYSRLLAYLQGGERTPLAWTGEELKRWTHLAKIDGVLIRGAKKAIEETPNEALVSLAALSHWFTPEALGHATAQDVRWLLNHSLASARSPLEFPIKIVEKRGMQALVKTPQVLLGTIHCSPPDEQVLTTDGYVAMDRLDPTVHRLAGYHRPTNRLGWGGRDKQGFPFVLAKSPYTGPLHTLRTAASTTRVTPTHRVRVCFSDRFYEKWVVYLMRRRNWWRVGMCTSARLGSRLATEQADGGWILGVYESREDALIAEATIQGKYGIPSLTFETSDERTLNRVEVYGVYEAVQRYVQPRARRLLSDFGLDEAWPLYTRNGKVRTETAFETIAANVLDGYMLLPTTRPDFEPRSTPEWHTVSVSKDEYTGDVYSLETPYEHYISGGAVVHNSVKGAEADVVYLFPDMSPQGMGEWQAKGEPRDAVIRQFYVGMTRARETLVLGGASSEFVVPLPTQLPEREEGVL